MPKCFLTYLHNNQINLQGCQKISMIGQKSVEALNHVALFMDNIDGRLREDAHGLPKHYVDHHLVGTLFDEAFTGRVSVCDYHRKPCHSKELVKCSGLLGRPAWNHRQTVTHL